MNMEQYRQESARTVSDQFNIDKVEPAEIGAILEAGVRAGALADKLKRTLFYGTDFPRALSQRLWAEPGYFSGMTMTVDHIHPDIIHGILGKFTEAAEMLEALLNAMKSGEPLDNVNLKEEVGDGLWYDALILRCIGETFEDTAGDNLRKLKVRFPEKFTAEQAAIRDLFAERMALET